MKTTVSFIAYRRSALKYPSEPGADSVSCELSDSAFEELEQIINKRDARSIEIVLDEDSIEYKKVINLIISDTGKRPSEFVGVGVRRGEEFLVSRENHYTNTEITQAPALLVVSKPNLVNMMGMENGVPTYKANTVRQKEFGAIFPSWRMGVTENLADFLKHEKLKGLGLIQMKAVGKSPVIAPVYWIKPTIQLPRCMLNVCDNRGNPVAVENSRHQIIARSCPLELVYEKMAFGKACDFDLAFTYERPGSGDLVATELLVVSQKFRLLLESRGCDGIEFTPVRLVDC